jgi:hypothetical protein
MRFQVTAIAFVALLCACAVAPRPQPSIKPDGLLTAVADKASIYVLRPERDARPSIWPALYVDGQEVAGLIGGSFTRILVNAGTHEIAMRTAQLPVGEWDVHTRLDVQAGQRYFLMPDRELRHSNSIVVTGRMVLPASETRVVRHELKELEADVAISMIMALDYIAPIR